MGVVQLEKNKKKKTKLKVCKTLCRSTSGFIQHFIRLFYLIQKERSSNLQIAAEIMKTATAVQREGEFHCCWQWFFVCFRAKACSLSSAIQKQKKLFTTLHMTVSKCPIQFRINNLQIGVFSYLWTRSYPLYFVLLSKSPKFNGSAVRTLWDLYVQRDGKTIYKKKCKRKWGLYLQEMYFSVTKRLWSFVCYASLVTFQNQVLVFCSAVEFAYLILERLQSACLHVCSYLFIYQ